MHRKLWPHLDHTERLLYPGRWAGKARAGQLPPRGEWRQWLVCAGRGFGKTRAGAEWVIEIARLDRSARIALVAASLVEARAVMVEGESGILACARPKKRPRFEPSLRRLSWPNGALAFLYSAAEPKPCAGRSTATPAGQAQKEFTVNEALARIDALLHPAIEGVAADPPGLADEGECWLIDAAPTGAWSGHAGEIACREAGSWIFLVPRDGMRLLDRASGQSMLWRGGWTMASAPPAPAGGATVDAEARAAIAALIEALSDAGILSG